MNTDEDAGEVRRRERELVNGSRTARVSLIGSDSSAEGGSWCLINRQERERTMAAAAAVMMKTPVAWRNG